MMNHHYQHGNIIVHEIGASVLEITGRKMRRYVMLYTKPSSIIDNVLNGHIRTKYIYSLLESCELNLFFQCKDSAVTQTDDRDMTLHNSSYQIRFND